MFLEPGSFKERSLDMTYFTEWAGSIASSYLNSNLSPTDSLAKIAHSEGLTPHQIELLASEANKEIHKHKYASADDKYFAADFPLADAKKAISSLQADGGSEKLAVNLPEPILGSSSPEIDFYKAFGVEPEVLDKTASVKKNLKFASIGGNHIKDRLQDKVLMAKFAADAAEEKFIKQARQLVIQEPTAQARVAMLGKLAAFVKSSDILEGMVPLAKVAYIVGQEGLIPPNKASEITGLFKKIADQTAPEELISKWLPCQVVNGEHPLYITLKTVKENRNMLDDYKNEYKIVQDKLDNIKQYVRAL